MKSNNFSSNNILIGFVSGFFHPRDLQPVMLRSFYRRNAPSTWWCRTPWARRRLLCSSCEWLRGIAPDPPCPRSAASPSARSPRLSVCRTPPRSCGGSLPWLVQTRTKHCITHSSWHRRLLPLRKLLLRRRRRIRAGGLTWTCDLPCRKLLAAFWHSRAYRHRPINSLFSEAKTTIQKQVFQVMCVLVLSIHTEPRLKWLPRAELSHRIAALSFARFRGFWCRLWICTQSDIFKHSLFTSWTHHFHFSEFQDKRMACTFLSKGKRPVRAADVTDMITWARFSDGKICSFIWCF